MNAMAFGVQADPGIRQWFAIGIGLSIPAFVYLLSRVAFGLATTTKTA
jgi:hypothetical protein